MKTAILLAVLLIGLVFLPAWAFAAFSACLLLRLPTARWPRAYSWLARAIIAPLMAGIGFLSSWGVSVVLEGGQPLPLAQLVPSLGIACEQSEQVFNLFSMAASPTCRLLLHDPRREYGLGLFLQLLLLINLVCIRMWNLQLSMRESDARAEGFAGICLFVLWLLTLSFITYLTDKTLAELIEGPYVIPLGVSYAGAAIYVFLASGVQVQLYPRRKSAFGL